MWTGRVMSYAPERWVDDAVFRPEVREAYRRFVEQGWTDALRALHPGERIYTFWLRSSLPQRLMAIAHEGRQYIRDDTPLAGFDFCGHGHPRFECQRPLFGLYRGLVERNPRDIGGVG
jgi:hypothetical protein